MRTLRHDLILSALALVFGLGVTVAAAAGWVSVAYSDRVHR